MYFTVLQTIKNLFQNVIKKFTLSRRLLNIFKERKLTFIPQNVNEIRFFQIFLINQMKFLDLIVLINVTTTQFLSVFVCKCIVKITTQESSDISFQTCYAKKIISIPLYKAKKTLDAQKVICF